MPTGQELMNIQNLSQGGPNPQLTEALQGLNPMFQGQAGDMMPPGGAPPVNPADPTGGTQVNATPAAPVDPAQFVSGQAPPAMDYGSFFNPDGTLNIQAIMAGVGQQQEWANQANLQRYQDILGQFQGLGEAGMQRIEGARQQAIGTGTQDLISRGLYNTTIAGGIPRAAGADAEMARQSLQEGIQAQMAGVMERRSDIGPNLGFLSSLISAGAGSTAGQPTPGAGDGGQQGLTQVSVPGDPGESLWSQSNRGAGGFGGIGGGGVSTGGGGGGGSTTLQGTGGPGITDEQSLQDLRRIASQRGIPLGSARDDPEAIQQILDTYMDRQQQAAAAAGGDIAAAGAGAGTAIGSAGGPLGGLAGGLAGAGISQIDWDAVSSAAQNLGQQGQQVLQGIGLGGLFGGGG